MFKKIPANAMYFAILISAIVAVLLSSFLLLVYLSQRFENRAITITQNIESVNHTFDSINQSPFRSSGSTDELFWGGYSVLRVASGASSFDFKKIGLLGKKLNPVEDPILYLQDRNMPLVLAGNSKLEGDIFIPSAFIKSGSVDGNYFVGIKPVGNKIRESLPSLPDLNPMWVKYIDSIRNSYPSGKSWEFGSRMNKNSFFSEQKWVYSNNKIILTNEYIGNIIIKSAISIIVEPSSKLEDVLLIAPRVIVRTGFKGSLHIVSEEAILEAESFLKFPSSITIINNKKKADIQSRDFRLKLGANSTIHGNIVLFSDDQNNYKKDLKITNGSKIIGGVYNEGFTDLQGSIYGELYTGGFAAYSGGSVYINHIFNGNIYESPLGSIAGIPLKNKDEIVAKWMY